MTANPPTAHETAQEARQSMRPKNALLRKLIANADSNGYQRPPVGDEHAQHVAVAVSGTEEARVAMTRGLLRRIAELEAASEVK